MAIKSTIDTIEITSEHNGYLVIKRNFEQNELWLELIGDKDFPLILETSKDIDDLCKMLQDNKKLLK